MFIELLVNVSHSAHRMRKIDKVPKTCISIALFGSNRVKCNSCNIRVLHPRKFLVVDMLVQYTTKTFGSDYLSIYYYYCKHPGDFITKVTQINSQSDLISMSSFAGPPYLTIRSSVSIILI